MCAVCVPAACCQRLCCVPQVVMWPYQARQQIEAGRGKNNTYHVTLAGCMKAKSCSCSNGRTRDTRQQNKTCRTREAVKSYAKTSHVGRMIQCSHLPESVTHSLVFDHSDQVGQARCSSDAPSRHRLLISFLKCLTRRVHVFFCLFV